MAVVITETSAVQIGGGPSGRIRVEGSVSNDTTTFVIAPGYADTNITTPVNSKSLNKIDSWGFSNIDAEKAPLVVKSYSSGNDADILTITCASGDDYNYWVEGVSSGA